MNHYQVTVNHSDKVEAENEEDAVEKFLADIESGNRTLGTWLAEQVKVEKARKASELSGEALDKVLERFSEINVDHLWYEYDETPEEDVKEHGIEVDMSKASWDLEPRYRQLYWSKDGIRIVDMDKFLKSFKKYAKIPARLVKAIQQYEVELYFETNHYGGGDGKSILTFFDRSDDGITDNLKEINLDEALQGWFEKNIVGHILDYYQKNYDYLTSKEAIIETLDANEYLFTEDGRVL